MFAGYQAGVIYQPVTPPFVLRSTSEDRPIDYTALNLSDVEVINWTPRIFLYHNFISADMADYIVRMGQDIVVRSQVVSKEGGSEVHEARTSSGTFLLGKLAHDPVVEAVQDKIARWTQLPEENGEAFYLLRYEIGQQYKPHYDYFRSDAAGRMNLGDKGDRIATVIVYLGTPDEGGDTTFPKVQLDVPANKGNAILFWDALPDGAGDELTLHGGKPVIAGTKWCMTKWLRATPF